MAPSEVRHICVCLLLCLCAQIIAGQSIELCGPQIDKSVPGAVYFKVYNKNSNKLSYVEATAKNPESLAPFIDASKPTIMHLHGWVESTIFDTCIRIVKAYVARGDVNVIAVDWSRVAQDLNYPNVCFRMPSVGKAIATGLEKLSASIDPRRLHVIGYSLGAHLAGYVGKFMDGNIGRITGLEPALPLYYPGPCHLNPADAEVVVVIHTGSQILGTYERTGTLDIYINPESTNQPGCSKFAIPQFCNHDRSVTYFAEAISRPGAFPAQRCPKDRNGIEDYRMIYVGDATPTDVRGAYCLTTNRESPFGPGHAV